MAEVEPKAEEDIMVQEEEGNDEVCLRLRLDFSMMFLDTNYEYRKRFQQ
jgi:hypothetical protein